VLRIGADEVWKINQADGLYTVPPVSNAAYGRTLYIRGDFSVNLKTGSPKRYYKLSYAKVAGSGGTPPASAFTPIKMPLTALRASYLGSFETYLLGPKPVGAQMYLSGNLRVRQLDKPLLACYNILIDILCSI
jgi:hypothetical protein